MPKPSKPNIAFVLGLGLSLLIGNTLNGNISYWLNNHFSTLNNEPDHEEVHVHSDFALYINDKQIHFTDDKYQSTTNHVLLEDMHLHDNDDEVIHRHADGITLVQFLASLGYTLTEDCLTNDTGEEFCTDEDHVLALYVNGEKISPLNNYINQEEDQILLYYGAPDSPNLNTYLKSVTENACIFSGTCPEKGLPPPESCGLTCEI